MKKRIFAFAMMAFLFTFISCTKTEPEPEPEKVTLTFSGDIVVDLGATDADVLEFVTASDGSTVTVTGVDYDKPGEQTATFKTGDVSETKPVKIKADKFAGTYNISWFRQDGTEVSEGEDEAWKIKLTVGDAYNQIKIPSKIYSESCTFFQSINELVITFNGKEGASIPNYSGDFCFMSTPSTADFTFTDIEFGIVDGKYAIKSFKMEGEAKGISDFYYTATFVKTKD